MSMPADHKLGASDIAALIRREISKGNLQLHDRLAPERVLADTYGAARGTVRKALNLLEDEGFVKIPPWQRNLCDSQACRFVPRRDRERHAAGIDGHTIRAGTAYMPAGRTARAPIRFRGAGNAVRSDGRADK